MVNRYYAVRSVVRSSYLCKVRDGEGVGYELSSPLPIDFGYIAVRPGNAPCCFVERPADYD